LADLGYTVHRNARVRGFSGTTPADLVVWQPNGYDVGFVQAGDHYDLVANWWGCRLDRDQFTRQVHQRYAYHAVVDSATRQGFSVAEEHTEADGTVRVVMQRWR
jgi:hypothetical protein